MGSHLIEAVLREHNPRETGMAIDYDKLKNWVFEPVVQTYDWRFSAMYALGVGYGFDPMDTQQLRFVYEPDMLEIGRAHV